MLRCPGPIPAALPAAELDPLQGGEFGLLRPVNYNSPFPSVFIPGLCCSRQSHSLYLLPFENLTHALLPPPFSSAWGLRVNTDNFATGGSLG